MTKEHDRIRANIHFSPADGELFSYLLQQQQIPGANLGLVIRRLCAAGLLLESMTYRGAGLMATGVPSIPLQSESAPRESSTRVEETATQNSPDQSNGSKKSEDAVPLYADQLASIPLGLDFD